MPRFQWIQINKNWRHLFITVTHKCSNSNIVCRHPKINRSDHSKRISFHFISAKPWNLTTKSRKQKLSWMSHEQWLWASVDKLWTFRRTFLKGLPLSGNCRTVNPRASRVKAKICNLWESLLNERDFLQRVAEKKK